MRDGHASQGGRYEHHGRIAREHHGTARTHPAGRTRRPVRSRPAQDLARAYLGPDRLAGPAPGHPRHPVAPRDGGRRDAAARSAAGPAGPGTGLQTGPLHVDSGSDRPEAEAGPAGPESDTRARGGGSGGGGRRHPAPGDRFTPAVDRSARPGTATPPARLARPHAGDGQKARRRIPARRRTRNQRCTHRPRPRMAPRPPATGRFLGHRRGDGRTPRGHDRGRTAGVSRARRNTAEPRLRCDRGPGPPLAGGATARGRRLPAAGWSSGRL